MPLVLLGPGFCSRRSRRKTFKTALSHITWSWYSNRSIEVKDVFCSLACVISVKLQSLWKLKKRTKTGLERLRAKIMKAKDTQTTRH